MNRSRDDRPRRRQWLSRFLALGVGTLLCLVGLEAVLRTLPVSDALRTTAVNAENPIIRFEPGREITWSRDWDFSLVNQVRFNNFGFVSDFDYDPDATSPLLAVIGDSYVEALMVPFRETCAGRLRTHLEARSRVYAFGMSGAPLSQYLAFAEYARDHVPSGRRRHRRDLERLRRKPAPVRPETGHAPVPGAGRRQPGAREIGPDARPSLPLGQESRSGPVPRRESRYSEPGTQRSPRHPRPAGPARTRERFEAGGRRLPRQPSGRGRARTGTHHVRGGRHPSGALRRTTKAGTRRAATRA